MLKKQIMSLALGLAAGAAVLALFPGPGHRFGWVPFQTGLQLMQYSTWLAIGAAIIAFASITLGLLDSKRELSIRGVIALVTGAVIFVSANSFLNETRQAPRIHDLTTDTITPPTFVATNPTEYSATEQEKVYPDIQPAKIALPYDSSFAKAEKTVRELGWKLIEADPKTGRIEATDTSFWFGFQDDIVIRILPQENDRSRIDIRASARSGSSDLGRGAQHIRRFLEKISTP